ncbi:hypothetical protein [Candidatus Nitrosocosmicus franklandus]|uniref:Uncharacterized protein n=1 Tax=Candidatus Nitrosocosmicus franklandianus TaxID=1798806 RepID=A0A484IAM0_9ARCH|nr:hypothetical protein [Candidatus Nitrosocosmicus franklandus]VFJ14793.1 conserved protein of unknown function [Candidatus Nitrosocosmicus franklandus]
MYIDNVISEKKNSNPMVAPLNYSFKKFSSIGPFVDLDGKIKHCVICGIPATQEAIFTVDGAIIVEKYCDSCSKKDIK